MRDYLATAKAAIISTNNTSLNIEAKATVQTILGEDYVDLANEAQHASLCSFIQSLLDYNAGQILTEKIQSTNHILQAHRHICHKGKEELDKLEEEQKKIKAKRSTILARIDNAVQDSWPHQVELEKFMQQQTDF
ncbi:hypothetical protein L3X38_025201 [Prunus dulcis]|uniref:Uncharacterized protein n=1 Tax=Prunus dulcis TaxID=3755 RepID=A0AAD4W2F0_PRUDU|nr:hypothetical protein L3X38_025201 [Prunus dulcis]